MNKPPIDPAEKFINEPMLRSLFLRSEPFHTSHSYSPICMVPNTQHSSRTDYSVCYMDVWAYFPCTQLQVGARTVSKGRLLSNKVMLLWALLVFVTLFAGTTLSPSRWVRVISVSFVATFWMELKKMLQRST
jgi:hypothetical protein